MSQDKRFLALESLFNFYDCYIQGFNIVCSPGCNVCCTNSVTATGLEVDYLLNSIPHQRLPFFIDLISPHLKRPIFRPNHTTNQIAEFCKKQISWDDNSTGEYGEGKCPFLSDEGLCLVYDRRPFSCRAMISQTRCQTGQEACMESFLVTVNLSIFQIIEHLDRGGFYGNILDLIAQSLKIEDMREVLLKNIPLPGFMIPPDEKAKFSRFLGRLFMFKAGEDYMRDILDDFVIIN